MTSTSETKQIKVLLVEDDEDDYLLARRRLREIYGDTLQLEWADNYEKAEAAIRQGNHDVCLLDYHLGAHHGLELLKRANEIDYAAPIILMTGHGARAIDLEAMQAGAADYLDKGQLDSALLERSIRYAIQQKRSAAERLQLIREQTARQQAEEASRLKDEFLAVVSHELKTPLNAIKGWAELLRDNPLPAEETRRAIEAIARNAKAQQQIIEDLLDVSCIVTGKLRLELRPLCLATILKAAVETVRPSAAAKRLDLNVRLGPLPEKFMGDANRLQQVIWNVLSNAIKFTPEDGQVALAAEQAGDHVEIVVQDSGQGISPDFLPHVFDRFRQEDASTKRKQSGLGLGLSIVRQLVGLHGGTISADSTGAGHGARFCIKLPLQGGLNLAAAGKASAQLADNLEQADTTLYAALSGARVLVVDDEEDSRELIRHVLTMRGVEVKTAADAALACLMLEDWQPDVIVSDVSMPGVNGYEFMRLVRARAPAQGGQIPAVALTAYARTEDRLRALTAGFQMHVVKPVEPIELLTVVASLAERMR